MKLYFLILTDTELSYDNYSEDFAIGFFDSMDKAEKTAEYYLNNVTGFCKFPCTYRIIEKNLIGSEKNLKGIYIVQGWNINENLDEVDIIESQCFASECDALSELEIMKEKYPRDEWAFNYWTIGETEWKEGFCRWCNGEWAD
ncbi:MAG: hypothetical protein K2I06_03965 [Ruminococcus sp.]|nr:hypothetical protein [Ruminococcus sp.]